MLFGLLAVNGSGKPYVGVNQRNDMRPGLLLLDKYLVTRGTLDDNTVVSRIGQS